MLASISLIVLAALARAQSEGDVYGPNGVALLPNGSDTYCLEVNARQYGPGMPVVSYDCDDGGSRKWIINSGSTQVKINGHEDLCLDAGEGTNGAHVTVETCNGGDSQKWYYTTDNRIALEGKGQCLDLTNADPLASYIQTWECSDGNTNQIWVMQTAPQAAPADASPASGPVATPASGPVRRSRAHLQ